MSETFRKLRSGRICKDLPPKKIKNKFRHREIISEIPKSTFLGDDINEICSSIDKLSISSSEETVLETIEETVVHKRKLIIPSEIDENPHLELDDTFNSLNSLTIEIELDSFDLDTLFGIENNLEEDYRNNMAAAAQVSSAHKPNTFYGLSSENGIEFLRQFELYCQIHGIQLNEPEPNNQGVRPAPETTDACTRFQICISGDAARWYLELPDDTKLRWPDIKRRFREKYCDLINDWAENVSLRSISQTTDMPVEVYLNKFCEQVRRMGKNLQDCVADMVSGLRSDLQRDVILSSPRTAEDVMKFAKLAEVVANKNRNSVSGQINHISEGHEELKGVKGELLTVIKEIKQVTKNLGSENNDNSNNKNKKDDHSEVNMMQNGDNRGNNNNNGNNNNRNRNSPQNWNRGGNRGRFNGICYNCNIFGHRAADCRKPRMNRRGYSRPNSGFRNFSPGYGMGYPMSTWYSPFGNPGSQYANNGINPYSNMRPGVGRMNMVPQIQFPNYDNTGNGYLNQDTQDGVQG